MELEDVRVVPEDTGMALANGRRSGPSLRTGCID